MTQVLELDRPATTGAYRIERGIPAPAQRGGWGRSKYPLAQLEVGDSFFVPFGENPLKTRSVLSNAVAAFQLRNKPKKFTTRKSDDHSGVRVWRTA